MNYKAISCLIFILLNSSASFVEADDEPEVFTDKVFDDHIKTVQLFVDPLMLTDPAIPLGGASQLQLAFDDLKGGKENYTYTIIQCNYDWTRSELNQFDYLDGFIEQDIRDYEFSFNTNQDYTHYKLLFPNENIRITKSGNYIIEVYRDNDPHQVILTRRFIVFQSRIEITSNVQQAQDVTYSRTHQQLNFTVNYHGITVSNPFGEIKVLLMQNFRWDNCITDLLPQFVKPEILEYNYTMKTSFPGGKEFRYFDVRTTRYRTDRVKTMTDSNRVYHMTLFNDDIRNNQVYLYRQDINGKFIPGTLDYQDQDAQSEYFWVKFTLPVDFPLEGGKIFLLGKFTDWQRQPQYQMRYNSTASAYETSLYLKEGYYEYLYHFVPNSPNELEDDLMEGNSYETENTYQIFVYYRPFGSRYDQVIGYKATDTFNR